MNERKDFSEFIKPAVEIDQIPGLTGIAEVCRMPSIPVIFLSNLKSFSGLCYGDQSDQYAVGVMLKAELLEN